jgi:hypothetical protein
MRRLSSFCCDAVQTLPVAMHGAEVQPSTLGPRVTCSWQSGSTASSTRRRLFGDQQPGRAGCCSLRLVRVGVVGFDGPIDLQALRLYGLPKAPAVLNGIGGIIAPLPDGTSGAADTRPCSWCVSS